MTKSELISQLAAKQPQLDYRDVELAVKELLAQMGAALAAGVDLVLDPAEMPLAAALIIV